MGRTHSCRFFKETQRFRSVCLPTEQLGNPGSGFTQFLLKRLVLEEASKERGKFLWVFWLAQDQASLAIFDHLAGPGPSAGNDGQGAGHRLKNRQAKSIFQGR